MLALAELDNVAIKISGACTLSHQPFPYPDVWAPLRRVFDAYGLDRCHYSIAVIPRSANKCSAARPSPALGDAS